MLSFSRLGKDGRLGNQLFQIAFLTSFAKRYNIPYKIPYWPYEKAFSFKFEFAEEKKVIAYDRVIYEPSLAYSEEYFKTFLPDMQKGNVDIAKGYFQSHKYFDKQHVLNIFNFKLKPNLQIDFRKSVAISVRRGNFVNHSLYNNIEGETFRQLLDIYFKGFYVFVFSDDYDYCRKEFVGGQFEFFEGFSDIEQLLVFSQFKHFILSNSTFSYWGPMLNSSPISVWYPEYMFPNLDWCEIYNRDYWPKNDIYKPYRNPINKPFKH